MFNGTLLQEEFPNGIKAFYLNSANLSLCPRSVGEAQNRYRGQFESNPTQGLSHAWGKLWEAQTQLAAFFHARAEDLFLRKNVTEALNQFILGSPLPAGSEILVGELEYGSALNICRFKAAKEQLTVRRMEMPVTLPVLQTLDNEKLTASIVSQLGPQTKMLLLSHVLGGTGLVLPIEQLAQETSARNIMLVVDGAYAPGAIPVDFSSALANVDFYGCSLYKWMLGPKGTGFGWVNPKRQDSLVPLSAGWTTFDNHGPFTAFGAGSAFQEKFMLQGCQDFSPFLAIVDCLHFWKTLGAEAVRQRIKELSEAVDAEMARQLGWASLSAGAPELNSAMRVYRLPEKFQAEGFTFAKRYHEQCGVQAHALPIRDRWHVAFSAHLYNDEEEIAEAIKRLKERL